jgi:predicted  nucleic acid-binding Zn-ribbon protein
MNLQVNELLALQALDNEIGKLNQENAGLDRGDKIERALAIREGRLQAAEKRLQGLEIEQRNAELELKGIEDKKHHESQRLYDGRITAPRELQALELEIAMLDRQRLRLDDQILKRVDEIQAAKKTVETAQAAVDEARKALSVMQRRFQKASARITELLAAKEPERERVAKSLEADTLRRYNDIRRRSHNVAAVRVEIGACGGCRMKVGQAVLRRLVAHDQYVFCESCSRYLFPADEPPPAPPAPKPPPKPRASRAAKPKVVAPPPVEAEAEEAAA